MTSEDTIRFVLSFIGGGIVATIGGWVHSTWSARRAREADLLAEQLRLLYGPLFFLTSQNEELFKLTDNVRQAYSSFFERKNWSQESATQNALGKQTLATIELGNSYVRRVIENNGRLMQILEQNWHLADTDDVEALSQFQVDYTRYLVEVRESGAKDLPFNIIMDLGNIPFMRSEMANCVRSTFQRKRSRLVMLAGQKC